MNEYAGANFNHPGKALHRTKKAKKAVYDANNARNRDSFSITNSNAMLKDERSIPQVPNGTNLEDVENLIITIIDLKNQK